MLLARALDTRICSLYREGIVPGPVYSQQGQEAIAVGSAFALRLEDPIVPSHRSLGAYLVRGVPASRLLARVMGGERAGLTGDMDLRILPPSVAAGATVPLAA